MNSWPTSFKANYESLCILGECCLKIRKAPHEITHQMKGEEGEKFKMNLLPNQSLENLRNNRTTA